MGKGRKTRRALERGGAGPAKRLNETLAGWSGVRITPMFGRWSYFVGETLFGCFPLREKERDLWVRLAEGDQARALTEPASVILGRRLREAAPAQDHQDWPAAAATHYQCFVCPRAGGTTR